jgi:hypothetical protein
VIPRLPQLLENLFTDGGEVVGLTRLWRSTARKICGTSFC